MRASKRVYTTLWGLKPQRRQRRKRQPCRPTTSTGTAWYIRHTLSFYLDHDVLLLLLLYLQLVGVSARVCVRFFMIFDRIFFILLLLFLLNSFIWWGFRLESATLKNHGEETKIKAGLCEHIVIEMLANISDATRTNKNSLALALKQPPRTQNTQAQSYIYIEIRTYIEEPFPI